MIEDMVKKGCHGYMRMYPALARDIFQVAALAALKRGGEEDGAMMLRIKGAVKNFLAAQGVVTTPKGQRVLVPVGAYLDSDSKIKTEEDYYREAAEAIEDFVVENKREEQILYLLALGYRKKDISDELQMSMPLIHYHCNKIRKRNEHHRHR